MADIGLNQNVAIKSRQFHIQTSTHVDEGLILTEIFEKGRLLYSEYNNYERRDYSRESGAELRMRRLLDQFHHGVISSLETLFELSSVLEEKRHHLSHHRLGAIFLSLNIFDRAEQHFLKAIDIDSKYYSSYVLLGKSYFMQKKLQQASQTLEPLMKNQISFPDLYNLQGLIALEQRNYNQALNHFRRAIKLHSKYKEAFFNLITAILQRINVLRAQDRSDEIQKNIEFIFVILNKIQQIGHPEDKKFINQAKQILTKKNYGKFQTFIQDYRHQHFYKKIAPEVIGYEFYLWLRFMPERLQYDALRYFNDKISQTLAENPGYPDMWNYLALIHLMLCRNYFLKGLDNFKAATKINPRFEKARKNLRLVENDGREFLSLIKAIIKD